jgi:hypothetical protein
MQIAFLLLCLVAISAVVSLALGAFVHSRPVALGGSLIITEMIVLVLQYHGIASSSDAPEILLLPIWMAVVIAPIILLTAWACAVGLARLRRSKP